MPSGRQKNQNAGPALLAVTSTLWCLAVVTTGLRLCTRRALGMTSWDDYTIGLTALLATIRFGFQIGQARHGNGRHRVYLSEEDYINNTMLGWFAMVFLFASACFLKISICLLILRIKDTRPLKMLLYTVMAGLVATNFGVIVELIAQCNPISHYWRPTEGGRCWDIRVRIYTIYITIGFSILTDLLCSFLPLVVIWTLTIPLKTKAAVWALTSLGLLATGFGVARAGSLSLTTDDMSWTYCTAAIWSNVELFIGIIAANMALTRSLWRFLRHGTKWDDPRTMHDSYAFSSTIPGPASYFNGAPGVRDGDSDLEDLPSTLDGSPSLRRSRSPADSANSTHPCTQA
ncbi:hypothetical protein QBC46DRAFT_364621 [Diplogelasinospora grovesii]|uniref:Rhodopsin domain-containing protein n=1 Tax=Diplogelasinospora grovesii TaxID=303347 RepID=A0AAN6S3H7_9PEZI|nr:hypothetical protein QBC46DRAFT_364621 [Diplogelasinospora grovesii]